jgi:hypothetical protein
LPPSVPATNTAFTGNVAFWKVTLPLPTEPSRLTSALKSSSPIVPASSCGTSTISSTVPGSSGPHDAAPLTNWGCT